MYITDHKELPEDILCLFQTELTFEGRGNAICAIVADDGSAPRFSWKFDSGENYSVNLPDLIDALLFNPDKGIHTIMSAMMDGMDMAVGEEEKQ